MMKNLERKRSPQVLGWYVVAVALYQIVYAARMIIPTVQNPFPLLNPKLGLDWVVGNVLSLEDRGVGVMLLLAGALLLAVGVAILTRHQFWVKLYIVLEVVLSLPSIYIIGFLMINGGGHVVSGDDLPVLLFVFTLSTIIPLVLAIRSLKQPKTVDVYSPS